MKLSTALLGLLLASCHATQPDIRIKREVAESEITGTWVLDPNCSAVWERTAGNPTNPSSSVRKRNLSSSGVSGVIPTVGDSSDSSNTAGLVPPIDASSLACQPLPNL